MKRRRAKKASSYQPKGDILRARQARMDRIRDTDIDELMNQVRCTAGHPSPRRCDMCFYERYIHPFWNIYPDCDFNEWPGGVWKLRPYRGSRDLLNTVIMEKAEREQHLELNWNATQPFVLRKLARALRKEGLSEEEIASRVEAESKVTYADTRAALRELQEQIEGVTANEAQEYRGSGPAYQPGSGGLRG